MAHAYITLIWVESSQIAGIGYDPKKHVLAVRFKNWKGEATSLYHYANVSPEEYAAFLAADSKGKFFGAHIKPNADRYPYLKVESAPGVPA